MLGWCAVVEHCVTSGAYASLCCCRLSGTIDRNIEQMSYLQSLLLANNRFEGSIPDNLWYLASLTRLLLENNQLTGTIAETIKWVVTFHLQAHQVVQLQRCA